MRRRGTTRSSRPRSGGQPNPPPNTGTAAQAAATAMAVVPDEESQAVRAAAAGDSQPSSLVTGLSAGGGVSLSYRVSLSVEVQDVSDTGKATGGTRRKVIVDDACGTVAPGQVCVCVLIPLLVRGTLSSGLSGDQAWNNSITSMQPMSYSSLWAFVVRGSFVPWRDKALAGWWVLSPFFVYLSFSILSSNIRMLLALWEDFFAFKTRRRPLRAFFSCPSGVLQICFDMHGILRLFSSSVGALTPLRILVDRNALSLTARLSFNPCL